MNVCNLWFAGRTVTEAVRAAMIRRTKWFFEDRKSFMATLGCDLARITTVSQETGVPAYIRLNVASDLDWTEVIEDYPFIRFYDYCKIKSRCDAFAAGKLPENYWLTPSYSERMHINTVHAYLRKGMNVAVVYDTDYCPSHHRFGDLPKSFHGWPVLDGDKHDLRHPDFDGRGYVIGLRFKGPRSQMAEAIKRGFCVAA